MITEDFVNFETAKLLKEKGFEENCYTHYSSDGQNVYYNYQTPSDGINVPTLQMAMKWLREVHKIEARVIYDNEKSSWYGACNPMNEPLQILLGFGYKCKSYEEACESAIKYCLENLI